jgi:hypothetical protein
MSQVRRGEEEEDKEEDCGALFNARQHKQESLTPLTTRRLSHAIHKREKRFGYNANQME